MLSLVTLRLCAYRVRLDWGKPKWDVWCVGAAADADLQVLAGEGGWVWAWAWCGVAAGGLVWQVAKSRCGPAGSKSGERPGEAT